MSEGSEWVGGWRPVPYLMQVKMEVKEVEMSYSYHTGTGTE